MEIDTFKSYLDIQDLEEFSVSDSAKVLSDEQEYILTRCMLDVFLNSVRDS